MLAALRALSVEVAYHPAVLPHEVQPLLSDADVLILNSKVAVTAALVADAPRLRLVVRAGVGMDHIAVDDLAQRGITAVYTAGANADSVAEHTIGMLLALQHHLFRANAQVRQFQWLREANRGTEIGGKTVGIIGLGHTGSAVAKRLQAFGCHVLAYDKYKKTNSSLADIFQQTDILSLHIPLTPETRNFADDAFFAHFQKPITFLNLARGEITDIAALIRALDAGKVRGAALDVLENEKLDTLTPAQRSRYENLFSRENVLLSPHIGGWSHESKRNIEAAIVEIVQGFRDKEQGARGKG
jgi:D-3-phosphoglycerate dehydrogenase